MLERASITATLYATVGRCPVGFLTGRVWSAVIIRRDPRRENARMRRSSLRKVVFWLAPGCMLWLSCPSGTGPFLAPIIQPILGQALSDIVTAVTQNVVDQIESR